MPSDVQIANMALARIGVKESIDAFTDATQEAEMAKLFYAQCLDTALASIPWPFAQRRATLAALVSTRTNWTYVYSLPTDCIAPHFIVTLGTRRPNIDQRWPFAIEANDAGDAQVLVSDCQNAELVYTARVTSTAMFPALFIDALTWLLASELVMPLAIKPDMAVMARKAYDAALNAAAAAAWRGEQEDPEPDSEFIQFRGGDTSPTSGKVS